MITIHDLLEDPIYKAFFCKVPPLPAHTVKNPNARPWRLFVKYKGESDWRSRDFKSYKEAFIKLKSLLPRVTDASITCKSNTFDPPFRVVRVKGKFHTDKQGRYILDAEGRKKQITRMVPWKAKMPADEFEDHVWCPYCRRPTVFKYFISHHALPLKRTGGMPIDPTVMRCSLCGASSRLVNPRGN